jgi:hypothetical protein
VELVTYTSVFRIERRLYKVFDIELPRPVSLVQASGFVAVITLMLIVGPVVGLTFSQSTAWLYISVSAVVSFLASQPIVDAKRPHELVSSRVRYLFEPKELYRLEERREPASIRFRATLWHGKGAP